ncbi:hypothetical protein EVA_14118, partial [gut metagenome]
FPTIRDTQESIDKMKQLLESATLSAGKL